MEHTPDLHAQIMNIQPKPYDGTDAYDHYCRGHRDARHAAAELAAAASPVEPIAGQAEPAVRLQLTREQAARLALDHNVLSNDAVNGGYYVCVASPSAAVFNLIRAVEAEHGITQGKPRFPMTYCSQCGKEQGPGDAGVSHCIDHRRTYAAAHGITAGPAPAAEPQDRSGDLYDPDCPCCNPEAPPSEAPAQAGTVSITLTPEQVQAIYLTLFRRQRPAFGWMEQPLLDAEKLLEPIHSAIHDRQFDAMDAAFWGRSTPPAAPPARQIDIFTKLAAKMESLPPGVEIVLTDNLWNLYSSSGSEACQVEASAVPEGWKLVPVEATAGMVDAYLAENTRYWEECDALPRPGTKWTSGTPQGATAAGYRLMLSAAPSPQQAAPVVAWHVRSRSNPVDEWIVRDEAHAKRIAATEGIDPRPLVFGVEQAAPVVRTDRTNATQEAK